jgi:hypothetical protein
MHVRGDDMYLGQGWHFPSSLWSNYVSTSLRFSWSWSGQYRFFDRSMVHSDCGAPTCSLFIEELNLNNLKSTRPTRSNHGHWSSTPKRSMLLVNCGLWTITSSNFTFALHNDSPPSIFVHRLTIHSDCGAQSIQSGKFFPKSIYYWSLIFHPQWYQWRGFIVDHELAGPLNLPSHSAMIPNHRSNRVPDVWFVNSNGSLTRSDDRDRFSSCWTIHIHLLCHVLDSSMALVTRGNGQLWLSWSLTFQASNSQKYETIMNYLLLGLAQGS